MTMPLKMLSKAQHSYTGQMTKNLTLKFNVILSTGIKIKHEYSQTKQIVKLGAHQRLAYIHYRGSSFSIKVRGRKVYSTNTINTHNNDMPC